MFIQDIDPRIRDRATDRAGCRSSALNRPEVEITVVSVGP